jgi:RND family efflux transporter MFP subunit
VDRSSSTSLRVRRGLLTAGVAALALAVAACGKSAGQEEIASDDVPTITAEIGGVTSRDLVDTLLVRGSVMAIPNQDVKISAQVAGRVVAMHVAEGDAVAAGQVVADIEIRPLEDQRRQAAAALGQANAALENAKLNLARTERLFQRGIAAGKEVEDARTQLTTAESGVEQATAALDTADRQVARTHVTSPIAGYVVKRLVNVGEQVDGTAAQPLVEVANLDLVEVAASLPAESLGRVRTGQSAVITSDSYKERTFPGTLIAVAPVIDPATNAATGRIRVRNADGALKVGMFAQVSLALDVKKGVLTVPPTAVSRGESGAAVYVVAGDIATRTPVTLGLETPEAIEILSGVTQGQKVLTSSVHGLGERARLAKSQ